MESTEEFAAVLAAVTRYRQALDATLAAGEFAEHLALKTFPANSCGHVAEFLRQHLCDRGLGMWDYVCGQRTTPEGKWGTHAWVEREDTIIDVTGDQFQGEGQPAVWVAASALKTTAMVPAESPPSF